MNSVQLDCAYSMQLDGLVKARVEKENLRHLALMAREAIKARWRGVVIARRRAPAVDLVGPPFRR